MCVRRGGGEGKCKERKGVVGTQLSRMRNSERECLIKFTGTDAVAALDDDDDNDEFLLSLSLSLNMLPINFYYVL